MGAKEVSGRAQRVHNEAIVIDALQSGWPWPTVEVLRKEVRKFLNSGVTAIQISVTWINQELDAAIAEWVKVSRLFEAIEEAKFAFTAADIESAKKEGKLAVIRGVQCPRPYERDLSLISVFYSLGLRVSQLAYYKQTLLASGCGERVDGGLTDRGREAITEFNRLGILLDVSHGSDKTAIEAAKASKAPIVMTHATPRSRVGMIRARSDEAIKAVAETGGVIGQMFLRPFSERDDKMGVRPTLSDVIDHIDYLVKLVGVDSVGLGIDHNMFWHDDTYLRLWATSDYGGSAVTYPYKLDFPWEEKYPAEFEDDPNKNTIRITEELLRHGYSDDDTKKIMGGNWLRVFKEAWK